jgi:arylsulfatase A-like enzyme
MNYFAFLLVIFTFIITGCSNSKDNFNVVLITIDTLRADHLSCYGYNRETSPHIDKVAERGILFKNTIAPSSWTAPSMVSLFTSTYPINHGVIHGFNFRREREKRKQYSQAAFSDSLATLPEILKKQGYTTFGVSSNYNLTLRFGFARGFDYFKYRGYHLGSATAEHINELVYLWEDKIKKSEKYFLWVHYMDPHYPYNARSPWIEHYDPQLLSKANPPAPPNPVDLYDSEINYVDSYVRNFMQKFDLDKKTLLIITSDHGEQFFERGRLGHAWNLHQEEIHVPLIIQLPDRSEMVKIENQTSLLDIVPTILHVLDIDPPEQTIGKVLLKDKEPLNWLKTMFSRASESRHIFSELDKVSALKAIITPAWKYIYNYKNKTDQLYSITSDPNELNNLADKNPKQCTQLNKELLHWAATSKTYPVKSKSFEMSQEEKEKLEAMGYVATEENMDYDKDGMPNDMDNCPNVPNQDQEDTDGNGIGNKCEPSLVEYHWLEAEDADTIIDPLEIATDDNASEGRFIYSQNGKGNEYVPSSIMATYTVNISQAGDYVLLGRVKVIDKRDNSFFVQIDNGSDDLWEIETGNYWHWDAVNNRDDADPVQFSLTKGVHTINIKLREDGTKLDKMLLTNNVTFVPRGKEPLVGN